jgi:hypothetical protein
MSPEHLVTELVRTAADFDDAALEDAVCTRLGELIRKLEETERNPDPDLVISAVLQTACEAVRAAFARRAQRPEGWREPWRVFTALAAITPEGVPANPLRMVYALAQEGAPEDLEEFPPTCPEGPLLWTWDELRSRIAVTTAFPDPAGGTPRWYLWDVDVCTPEPYVAFSGYFPGRQEALQKWAARVGTGITARSTWRQVDDRSGPIVARLLPGDASRFELDGVERRYTECHRSRRLAEEIRYWFDEVGEPDLDEDEDEDEDEDASGDRDRVGGREGAAVAWAALGPRPLDPAVAPRRFAAWRSEHRPGVPTLAPDDPGLLLLSGLWFGGRVPEVRVASCSPHRTAAFVEQCRRTLAPEVAAMVLALLPDWVKWFGQATGVAAGLAALASRHADGSPHCSDPAGQGLPARPDLKEEG